MEWELKLRTRYVGLIMNVLGYRFQDDIPTKLAAFERTVHDYENQSTKTVDDDIKIGVTMLGMEDMRVKEHLIRNSVRITSWNQMREEILDHANTTVHRQSTNANAARNESEEQRQGQREQRQRLRQGHQGQTQGKGREERIVQESKERRLEKVLLLQQDRPREGRVQKETERPCRGRGETGGSVATSTRHSSGRAVVNRTPSHRVFSRTFAHISSLFTCTAQGVARRVLQKSVSSTCHHVSDCALSLFALTSSSLPSVSTFCCGRNRGVLNPLRTRRMRSLRGDTQPSHRL